MHCKEGRCTCNPRHTLSGLNFPSELTPHVAYYSSVGSSSSGSARVDIAISFAAKPLIGPAVAYANADALLCPGLEWMLGICRASIAAGWNLNKSERSDQGQG